MPAGPCGEPTTRFAPRRASASRRAPPLNYSLDAIRCRRPVDPFSWPRAFWLPAAQAFFWDTEPEAPKPLEPVAPSSNRYAWYISEIPDEPFNIPSRRVTGS